MNQDALTAVEVADILKVAKNTVYKLVKNGELRCYMVGRKMRFTYQDVQDYIERSRPGGANALQAGGAEARYMGEADLRRAEPARTVEVLRKEPVITPPGSEMAGDEAVGTAGPGGQPAGEVFRIFGQDLILDTLGRKMQQLLPGQAVERVYQDSYRSLTALYQREASAAAAHMWDAETDSYNLPYLRYILPGCPVAVVHICKRTQGFYVAEGNPKQIKSWEDLARGDLRIANREPGAGTRVLLDMHLQRLGIAPGDVAGYDLELGSHFAVAGSVSKGEADIGVGTLRMALGIRGISFVPLQEESYDLVVRKEDVDGAAVQAMLQVLRSEEFQEEFRYLNGYDISGMGEML